MTQNSADLPSEVIEWASTLGFDLVEELAPGYCSRIFRSGNLILKVPFQGEERLSGARAALTIQAVGGPEIFAHHHGSGALLMEFIPGGENLRSQTISPEDELPFICLALQMRSLDTDGCLPLTTYYDHLPDFAHELLRSSPNDVFLHGDLHHENILFDPRSQQYRPIDPKGLAGDPHFECVAFLRNPIDTLPDHPDLYNFTVGRIERLAQKLELDPYRVAAWLYVDRADDIESPRWARVLPIFEDVMRHFGGAP